MHLAQHSVNRSVTVSNVRFQVGVCTAHNTDTITLSGYVPRYKQYVNAFDILRSTSALFVFVNIVRVCANWQTELRQNSSPRRRIRSSCLWWKVSLGMRRDGHLDQI